MAFHEVIFRGGLGNQIFCLFKTFKISLKYGTKVKLNLTNYSLSRRKDRAFILNNLYLPLFEEFDISSTILSKFLFYLSRIIEKIFIRSKFDRLPGDKSFSINYFPNRFIHAGYFQKINETELDKKCLELVKKKFSPYISGIKNNYLAIHLRRGDYLKKNSAMHGIISEKYLVNESKNLLLKEKYQGITIFSDSPELIDLSIFKKLHNNIVIDEGGDPIEVFKRMSNHKGLIASNSTFSLWAGILGEIKNFSIPNYWMKDVKSSVIGLKGLSRYDCFLD